MFFAQQSKQMCELWQQWFFMFIEKNFQIALDCKLVYCRYCRIFTNPDVYKAFIAQAACPVAPFTNMVKL